MNTFSSNSKGLLNGQGLSRAALKRKKSKEKQQRQQLSEGQSSGTAADNRMKAKSSKSRSFANMSKSAGNEDGNEDEDEDEDDFERLDDNADDDDGDQDDLHEDDEDNEAEENSSYRSAYRKAATNKSKSHTLSPRTQSNAAKRPKLNSSVANVSSIIKRAAYTFDKSSIVGKTIAELLTASSTDNSTNSFVLTSNKTLALLIWPNEIDNFFSDFWGKSPLVCQHRNFGSSSSNSNVSSSNSSSKGVNICKGLFSIKKLERILDTQILFFNSDVNMVRFEDLKLDSVFDDRKDAASEVSPDAEGEVEVSAALIRQKFSEGYTVEFNSIAKYDDTIWNLLTLLEHVLESAVEPKVVWAPIGNGGQGRGPRVLQGDVILIQLEGCRKISIYSPIVGVHFDGELTRDKPLPDMPYLDIEVKGGDFVYVPRGWIIVAQGASDVNSLSLEINFNLTNTYQSLLEIVLPQALEAAAREHDAVRSTLPRNWMSFMGVSNSEADEGDMRDRLEDEDARREAFKQQLRSNLMSVVNSVMDSCDAAMDQMAKSFIGGRLPLPLTDAEEARSVIKSKDVVIASYTKLRVLRPNIARAVIEDGMVVVYHCQDNSRVMYGASLNPLEFELDDGPAIEVLLSAYPEGVTVLDLPHPSDELDDKIGVADALFKEGLLVIEDEATGGGGGGGGEGRDDDDDDDDDCPF